jgi:ArsR family transcriptional regulator, lead/cadmium/zinc/bismuth-responsive transcriptional repressor
MHLLPPERAGSPVIDESAVCRAIESLGEPSHIDAWSARFALLADPHRLAILVCVRDAGPISVTDLALATGMNATAVSQALRLLRTAKAVAGERDGRVIRYRLCDDDLDRVLAHATERQSSR